MDSHKNTDVFAHHAYYLVGNGSLRAELLSVLEKKHKIRAQGNPDLFDRSYITFTIDDAREVKSFHDTRPVGEAGKKIFILTMEGITAEAQNALLKLLEEPSEYAHFFLIIPSAHLLLPTVKSRMSHIKVESSQGRKGEGGDGIEEAKKFLKLSKAKQIDHIKGLMEDVTKEKKAKQDVIDLLNGIQAAVYEGGVAKNMGKLEAIEVARRYMNDRAPSLKMLLEFVALSL